MNFETFALSKTDGVMTIRLSNPPINLMSGKMVEELFQLTGGLRADPDVRVIVIESANPDFFIAHFDLNDIVAEAADPSKGSRYPDMNVLQSLGLAQAFHLLKEADEINARFETAADLPITMSTDLADAAAHADIFIDAAAEAQEVKRLVFKEADRLCPLDCILTSTTSMLDVFPLIATRRLSRFCVVHWYSPPYIIDLVEIAPGQETDPAVANELSALYAGMGKKPIVFDHFFPGYVANRVQTAITREIMSILDEGLATPAQIDDSLRHGLALRMALLGHLMRSDFTSLKLVQATLATVSDRGPVPSSYLLHELVAQGHYGVSTGKGFFNYTGRSPADLSMERDRKLIAMRKAMRCIEPILAEPFFPGLTPY